MQFIYPTFLFALFAVAIPIIIHLFNFRRYKKVLFSDIRFLKQVIEQNQKLQRLKKILILISRILAITFLVLAFAKPFIPFDRSIAVSANTAVSIFVDNSFSMNAKSKEAELLELAKVKAREIAQSYKETDQFQLLTHDFESKHQRLCNKKDFLALLDEVVPTASVKNLSEIISRQKAVFENSASSKKVIYDISDFQKKFSDFQNLSGDSGYLIRLLPVQSTLQNNMFVDSVWLVNPLIRKGVINVLNVRIRNVGNDNAENQTVVLKLNDVQKALFNFSVDKNSFTDISLEFIVNDAGWYKGEISITDYPIVFDDKMYFTFKAAEHSEVLLIKGNTTDNFIKNVYSTEEYFKVTEQNYLQIDYNSFSGKSLIVLNELPDLSSGFIQEILKYVVSGGVVFVIPSSDSSNINQLNNFSSQASSLLFGRPREQDLLANNLNFADPFFAGVFLKIPQNIGAPPVKKYYPISTANRTNGVSLISFNNSEAFLFKSNVGKGLIFYSSVPMNLTWSSFPQHSFFSAVMLKMAQQNGKTQNSYYTIGREKWLLLDGNIKEKVLHLSNKSIDIISDLQQNNENAQLYIDGIIKEPGFYSVYANDPSIINSLVAINYNRSESYINFYDEEEIESLSKDKGLSLVRGDDSGLLSEIKMEENGTPLWKYALILAFSFVLAEVALLRLMK